MFRTLILFGAVILALAPVRTIGPTAQRAAAGRGGAHGIVGRVTDVAGRGVGGVYVTVLRDEEARRGAPRLRPVDVRLYSLTNQNGEFLLENLSPDSYAIVALPKNVPLNAQNRPNRTGYGITYYPNATSAADAKSVRVTRSAGATVVPWLQPA